MGHREGRLWHCSCGIALAFLWQECGRELNASYNAMSQGWVLPSPALTSFVCSCAGQFPLYSSHSMNKWYFRAPFVVFQLVTNRKLVSVLGRTNPSGPQYSFCGPSRYRLVLPGTGNRYTLRRKSTSKYLF